MEENGQRTETLAAPKKEKEYSPRPDRHCAQAVVLFNMPGINFSHAVLRDLC